jgi:hypothetical protein
MDIAPQQVTLLLVGQAVTGTSGIGEELLGNQYEVIGQ